MLYIAGNMLGAWILSWFGFDNLVIGSMQRLFNITITSGDYYFIFACIGVIKAIVAQFHSPIKIKLNDED